MKDLMKHIYVLAVFLTAAIPASPAKQQESIRWSGNEKVKESLCLKADLSLSYDSDALIGADNGLIYVGAGDNRGSRVEFISYENKEDVEIWPVLEGLKGAPFGTVYRGDLFGGLFTEYRISRQRMEEGSRYSRSSPRLRRCRSAEQRNKSFALRNRRYK